MKNEVRKFQQFIQKQNLLWSTEREIISKQVFANNFHFTADELFIQLNQNGKNISRATVYRTLDLLVKSGLVENTQLQSGAYIYEHTKDEIHHDHLICNICGKIIEFHSDIIEEIQEKVCKENEFLMIGHTLRICGICKECRKKEK